MGGGDPRRLPPRAFRHDPQGRDDQRHRHHHQPDQQRQVVHGGGDLFALSVGLPRKQPDPFQRGRPDYRAQGCNTRLQRRQRIAQAVVGAVDQRDDGVQDRLCLVQPAAGGFVLPQGLEHPAGGQRPHAGIKDVEPGPDLGQHRGVVGLRAGIRDRNQQGQKLDLGLRQRPLDAVGIGGRQLVDLAPRIGADHPDHEPTHSDRRRQNGHRNLKPGPDGAHGTGAVLMRFSCQMLRE